MESALILVVVVVLFLVPALFTAAWNTAMPAMFGLPVITFWQGVSFLLLVSLLSSILFGGLRIQAGSNTSSNAELFSGLRQDVWSISNKVDRLQNSVDLLRQDVTMQSQPTQ